MYLVSITILLALAFSFYIFCFLLSVVIIVKVVVSFIILPFYCIYDNINNRHLRFCISIFTIKMILSLSQQLFHQQILMSPILRASHNRTMTCSAQLLYHFVDSLLLIVTVESQCNEQLLRPHGTRHSFSDRRLSDCVERLVGQGQLVHSIIMFWPSILITITMF